MNPRTPLSKRAPEPEKIDPCQASPAKPGSSSLPKPAPKEAETGAAETALYVREQRFRSLIENAQDVICVIHPQGEITFLSPSVQRVLGYAPEDLVARNILDLVHAEDREPATAWLQRVEQNQGTPEQIELRLVHSDGSCRILDFVGTGLLDEPSVHGIVLNGRDATERHEALEALRRSEAKLLQAQKMEAVGRLAGGIAHDFNNLLTAIRGNAELLLAAIPQGTEAREDVEEIHRAADRAAELTRQLLAFSRRQVLQPRVMNLNAVVVDVRKLLCRMIGEDVELVLELSTDLGTLRADPGQVEQVLTNLVVNARDAMPAGGKITLQTTNATLNDEMAARHPYVRPGEYVLLTVHDTGCGMDEETIAQAFDPFFTTKPVGQGTGLGLSTVYGIVKQSEGYIWIESEVGKGTSVRVYLPRRDQPVSDTPRSAAARPDVVCHGTVLLADDDTSVRKLTSRTLRGAGYRVLEAADGEEGLRLARECTGSIDLLITDVVMPRIGGRELAARVVAERPGTRVLFISGYSAVAVANDGVLGSGARLMEKPFSPESLLRAVSELLRDSDRQLAPGLATPARIV